MLKVKYNLTSAVVNNLVQIERFHGQLQAMQIPKELELNLERENMLQSSYISNSIEGNPLTLPEVTNLLLDDRVPANRDEKEVHAYFKLLKQMEELTEEMTVNLVKKLHLQLFYGVHDFAGDFRNKKVAVGRHIEEEGKVRFKIKHEPPVYKEKDIEKKIQELIEWEQASADIPVPLRAGIFHHHFVYIHPFEDGNGRVCRILTTFIFLKNNYPINKYFVLDDFYDIDRNLYSDKLHSADSGDKTEWLEYFTEGIMYSLQSALARISQNYNILKIENRPTPKEQEVLQILKEQREITAPQLGTILGVSRQQAHGLLSKLMEKGLVDKKGSTKSSYYFIK